MVGVGLMVVTCLTGLTAKMMMLLDPRISCQGILRGRLWFCILCMVCIFCFLLEPMRDPLQRVDPCLDKTVVFRMWSGQMVCMILLH